MPRHYSSVALAVVFSLIAACALAQSPPTSWAAHSGDPWVDRALADINQYGHRYPDAFIDELTRYDDAPREVVRDLLDQHWAPGDIYFACALAHAAGQPCRAVVDARTRDQTRAWQAIAQQFGVAPDSAPFDRIRRGLVDSYSHWARPLINAATSQTEAPPHPAKAAQASTDHQASSPAQPRSRRRQQATLRKKDGR